MVVRPKEDADGFFWGLDSSFVAASTINYLSRNIDLLQNSNNILHKYLEFNKQSIIFSFQKVSDRMEFILKRTIHSVDTNESLYPQTSLALPSLLPQNLSAPSFIIVMVLSTKNMNKIMKMNFFLSN